MSLHSPSQATLWQTLLPAVMVGTDKKTVVPPALQGPVGALLAQVQAQLDAADYAAAAQSVRALMFLDKFGEEVRFAYEALEA